MQAPDNLKDLFAWSLERTIAPELLDATLDLSEALKGSEWSGRLKGLVVEQRTGIWTFPLLHPGFCQALIWFSDLVGGYEPNPNDPYPGQELVTDKFGPLHEVVREVFRGYVMPMSQLCYDGFDVDRIDGSFVLKYEVGKQRSMNSHFDGQSDVSLTVVLNDDFEGGGHNFPRYNWSSKGLGPGHAIMFPGRVTHRHEGLEITGGKRYALVLWTRGDS